MNESPFRGALTPKLASELHDAAFAAGHDLLLTARMLLNLHRYGHSSAFAILAIEELCKTELLLVILLSDQKALADAWKAYRSHKAKSGRLNVAVTRIFRAKIPGMSLELARQLGGRGPTPDDLDALKQRVLYSDAVVSQGGSVRAHDPTASSSQELAEALVNEALVLAQQARHRSAREMEVFREHWKRAHNQPAMTEKEFLQGLESAFVEEGIVKQGWWKFIIEDADRG